MPFVFYWSNFFVCHSVVQYVRCWTFTNSCSTLEIVKFSMLAFNNYIATDHKLMSGVTIIKAIDK